jgi:DNA ligase 1
MKKPRPMLATKVSASQLEALTYPLLVQPKIDGIRCLITKDGAVSRNYKPIPNRYIRECLSREAYIGLDGELVAGDSFRETSSAVKSQEGTPNFSYIVFDVWNIPGLSFEERWMSLLSTVNPGENGILLCWTYSALDAQEVLSFHRRFIEDGWEGSILRSLSGYYKHGRSTLREQKLLKLKEFQKGYAVVVGVEELMVNRNPQTEDAFGLAERAKKKDLLESGGTLGALRCKTIESGVEFKIGTGFDDETRLALWRNPPIGEIVEYLHFDTSGDYSKPRFPSFSRILEESDA